MKTNQIGGVMDAVRLGPLRNPIPKLPSPMPPYGDVVWVVVGLSMVLWIVYLILIGCK